MRRRFLEGLIILWACGTAAAWGDPPQIPFWSGRLGDQTARAKAAPISVDKSAAAKESAAEQDAEPSAESDEPEWLKQLDATERTTLTGGWGLQNLSGGTASLTTAGDREGPYAPNTYQGSQFSQWNNLTTRQELPSWNGPTPGFPTSMWSQGYISPNNYFGGDAQVWGNMSSGAVSPNLLTGGWTMSAWR